MRKCAICLKKAGGGKGPFFKVPIEESERLLWSRSCHTQLRCNDYICADHFSRADMVCGGSKAKLLAKAVPFAPPSAVQRNSAPCLVEPPIELVKDCQTQTDLIVLECLKEMKISELNKEITKLKAENRELNYKLNDANILLTYLKKIFTEGQIRKMLLPNQNIKWSNTDISNAICLHVAGPKAYNHLYEKGFPLPHASTLQRWYRKSLKSEDPLAVETDCMEDMFELCDYDKI